MRKMAAMATSVLVGAACCSLQFVRAQDFMDIFSSFVDVDGVMNETHSVFDLARQAFAEEKLGASDKNRTFTPVDDAYPLAPAEFRVLVEFHAACKTSQAQALQTWCIGDATFVGEDDRQNPESILCPQNVRTHPCSGRVLGTGADVFEFLWPWEGVKCNAYTDPTTVTHMYDPRKCMSHSPAGGWMILTRYTASSRTSGCGVG